jgi:hypothetical protein
LSEIQKTGLIGIEHPDVVSKCVVIRAIRHQAARQGIEGKAAHVARVELLEFSANPGIADRRIETQIIDHRVPQLGLPRVGNVSQNWNVAHVMERKASSAITDVIRWKSSE